jgi:hypothetical protein
MRQVEKIAADREGSRKGVLEDSRINLFLAVYSATFLAMTGYSGARGDYQAYESQWIVVLSRYNPWDYQNSHPINAYGPLFNVLAALAWIAPLANKILFAISYLLFVVWAVKKFARQRRPTVTSWSLLLLWLLNPYPWEQIAYYGYFDILVALACVAAVHSAGNSRYEASGTYLALGTLLKFIPIVILPFLVFSNRRFNWRLLAAFLVVVIFGVLISIALWGTSTFLPLTFAATRPPVWSIYNVLASTYSPLRLFWNSPNADWLERPLLIIAGAGVFSWCVYREVGPALCAALAIWVTLLFYRIGAPNYYMVGFCLSLYWAIFEYKGNYKELAVVAAIISSFFCFLTVADISYWNSRYVLYSSNASSLVQFLLGSAVLVGLGLRYCSSR